MGYRMQNIPSNVGKSLNKSIIIGDFIDDNPKSKRCLLLQRLNATKNYYLFFTQFRNHSFNSFVSAVADYYYA